MEGLSIKLPAALRRRLAAEAKRRNMHDWSLMPIMNRKRNTVRENAPAYRTRMKKLGFRQINLWVPDTRAPNFKKECRRQSRLAAAADRSEQVDELSDAAAGSVEGWT